MQFAVAHDACPPIVVARAYQTRGDPHALAQLQSPWFLRDERVRPGFDDETVDPFGGNRPTESCRGLEDGDTNRALLIAAELGKTVRGGQAGDPASDDGNVRRLVG